MRKSVGSRIKRELEAELKESRLNYEMANFMYNMVNRVVIDLGYDFQDTAELDSVVFGIEIVVKKKNTV